MVSAMTNRGATTSESEQAAVAKAEPPSEPAETQTETPPPAQPETPPEVEPAAEPSPPPEVAPEPEPEPEPKAAPTRKPAPKASRPKPNADSGAAPAPKKSKDCAAVLQETRDAAVLGEWKTVLGHTKRKSCWSSAKTERERHRVRALHKLGRYAQCEKEGQESGDPTVWSVVDLCRKAADAKKSK